MEGKSIPYQILRSSRKTISLQINPDGTVLVRCPRRMGAEAVRAFVESKSDWIEKHLAKQAAMPKSPVLTRQELQALAAQAAERLPQRVSFFAPQVGVGYGRITIRAQRSRWGSCSAQGNLNFNCLLMLAPPEVLDSVVVHELCHRKEMNHSDKFYAEVLRVYPDYWTWDKWLKENGDLLMKRLAK